MIEQFQYVDLNIFCGTKVTSGVKLFSGLYFSAVVRDERWDGLRIASCSVFVGFEVWGE